MIKRISRIIVPVLILTLLLSACESPSDITSEQNDAISQKKIDDTNSIGEESIDSDMQQASTGDKTVDAGDDIESRDDKDTNATNIIENSNGDENNGNGLNGTNAKNSNNYTPPKTFTPGLIKPGIEPDVSNFITSVDTVTGKLTLYDGTIFDPVYYAAINPDVYEKYGYNTNDLLYNYLVRKLMGEGSSLYASLEDKKLKEEEAYREFARMLEEDANAELEEESANISESSEGNGNASGGGGGNNSGGGNAGGVTDNGDGTYTVSGTAGNAIVHTVNSWIYFEGDNMNIVLPLEIGGQVINNVGTIDLNGHTNITATVSYGSTTITRHDNTFTVNGNNYAYHARNFNDPNDPSRLTSVELSNPGGGGIRINVETGEITNI